MEKDKAIISATPRLLTIKKASLYSGLPVWAIRQLIWSEKIAYIRLGAKYYLDITDIEDWIRLNKIQKEIQKENIHKENP